MNSVVTSVYYSIIILSSTLVSAQDSSATDDTKLETNLPYEVIVRGDVTRASLRRLIVEVEEDFWDKFNELNIDNDYDVRCYKFKRTGSHLKARICEPNFYAKAKGENAHHTFFLMSSGSVGARRSAWLFTPNALRNEKYSEFEVLREKLEEFTSSEREFRLIGNAWADLMQRLDNYGND